MALPPPAYLDSLEVKDAPRLTRTVSKVNKEAVLIEKHGAGNSACASCCSILLLGGGIAALVEVDNEYIGIIMILIAWGLFVYALTLGPVRTKVSGGVARNKFVSELPPGYEQKMTHDQQLYYINHYTQTTQWEQPQLLITNEQIVSDAEVEMTRAGLVSHDQILRNPDQLLNFFTVYNTRPFMGIHVKGSHKDGRDTHIDFEYDLDVTPFISHHAQITSQESLHEDLHSTIDDYLSSYAILSSLTLRKTITWDEERVKSLITARLQDLGYRDLIDISFNKQNTMVKVDNDSASTLRSQRMNFFCIFTCLCLIGYPIKACLSDKKKLAAAYRVEISPEKYVEIVAPQIRTTSEFVYTDAPPPNYSEQQELLGGEENLNTGLRAAGYGDGGGYGSMPDQVAGNMQQRDIP